MIWVRDTALDARCIGPHLCHNPAKRNRLMTSATDSAWTVDLHGVRKTYEGRVEALKGIDVRAGAGEIFGLLGPNGAGKSTLVKIMLTVIRADAAGGSVLGQPIGHTPTKERIGYLPEGHQYPGYLSGVRLLDYYAALGKVPRATRRQRAQVLLDRLGMADWANQRVSRYSKGMLQRLGIAQALMNDPDLIVLDEPTDGLDPIGRRDVRVLLQELKRQGKTIFLNSHLLGELELVCDRVVILLNGQIVRQGVLAELLKDTLETRVSVQGSLEGLREAIGRFEAQVEGSTIVLPGQNARQLNELIDLLRARGILIESVVPRRVNLEDVFVAAMGGGARVGAAPVARPAAGGDRA